MLYRKKKMVILRKCLFYVVGCIFLIGCWEEEKNAEKDFEYFEAQPLLKPDYNFACMDTVKSIFNSDFIDFKSGKDAVLNKDSLLEEWTKLMRKKVVLPAFIDSSLYSKACLKQFHQLAASTGGSIKAVVGSKMVVETIEQIILKNAQQQTDIMLVIDKTSSMSDDIQHIRKGFKLIFRALKKYKGVRLSVATYGDRRLDGDDWYSYSNFEHNFADALNFIKKIKPTGGGDFPESAYDGVYKAFQEGFWQSNTKRIVILLGDAPSLVGTGSKHTAEEIIDLATREKIKMNFYPIVISPSTELVKPKEPKKKDLISSLYPNPSFGPVHLHLNNYEPYTIEIYNQNGQLVKTENVTTDHVELDLSSHKNGLYIVKVIDKAQNQALQKVILSK